MVWRPAGRRADAAPPARQRSPSAGGPARSEAEGPRRSHNALSPFFFFNVFSSSNCGRLSTHNIGSEASGLQPVAKISSVYLRESETGSQRAARLLMCLLQKKDNILYHLRHFAFPNNDAI